MCKFVLDFIFINYLVNFHNYRSYRDKTGKMRSFWEAVRPLVPLVFLFVTATMWIIHSPNNILEQDPRIVFFAIGTIFSNICVSTVLISKFIVL